MVTAYLLAHWRALALVATVAAVLIAVSALLTTCGTRSPAELSRRQERHVTARRDSALVNAARLDKLAQASAAHAARYYDSAKVYNDSLTHLRHHETDIIRLAAADTASYQRILSDIFGR